MCRVCDIAFSFFLLERRDDGKQVYADLVPVTSVLFKCRDRKDQKWTGRINTTRRGIGCAKLISRRPPFDNFPARDSAEKIRWRVRLWTGYQQCVAPHGASTFASGDSVVGMTYWMGYRASNCRLPSSAIPPVQGRLVWNKEEGEKALRLPSVGKDQKLRPVSHKSPLASLRAFCASRGLPDLS